MIYLKQSTASQEVILGPFVDDTDGKTAETGLTIAAADIRIYKAGASTAAAKNSGGASHVENGDYLATLDATDTNTVGSGSIRVSVAGALPVRHDFTVLPAAIYDFFFSGTTPASLVSDVQDGLATSIELSVLSDASAASFGAAQAVLDKVDETLEHTSDGWIFTVAALAQAPSGTGASAAAIAAAMFTEDTGESAGTAVAGSVVGEIIGAVPTAVENADALLDRDMSAGTDSGSATTRTPRQALRILRNRWTISGATQSIKKEDDSTESWSQTLGTTPGADPVTSTDPASA